jgi:hypothetical protein
MEDKIMKKTYILSSIRIAIWGCHSESVDEPRLLGCWRRLVRELVPEVSKEDITLKIKAVRSFEMPGSNYPTTRRNNPAYLLPQHDNKFATNRTFLLWVISNG